MYIHTHISMHMYSSIREFSAASQILIPKGTQTHTVTLTQTDTNPKILAACVKKSIPQNMWQWFLG